MLQPRIQPPGQGSVDTRRLTIGGVLADTAQRVGDKTFLTSLDDGSLYTYFAADQASNRLAHGLRHYGVSRAARVALMMENTPEHALLHFALAKLGATGVPINTAARGDTLLHLLTLSQVSVLVADEGLVAQALEALQAAPSVTALVVLRDRIRPNALPAKAGFEVIDFRELERADSSPVDAKVRFCDLAHIMFTSGTTGLSKGVEYTHARSLWHAIDIASAQQVDGTDVFYCWMPMFHLGGLQAALFAALVSEGRVALRRRFSASRFMSDLRQSGATITNLMGATLNMLWARPPSPDDREHRVRCCSTVPLPPFAGGFEERFGMRLVSGYGLTDCGLATWFTGADPASKLGSAGRAIEGWSVKIFDPDDFELPTGTTGEVVMRCERPWGSSTAYYRDPEATLAAWRNGWFHTGDQGFLDADGFLWLVGRTKDSIRRRSENISAAEVEHAILKHPQVAEAAVFPVKSELSEEEVATAVILKAGAALSEAELIAHCTGTMPRYMVPRYVQFVTDLPRTTSFKVQKFKLRELAEERLGLLWDRTRN
jgi:crotonobetaine/carnitine-CoA ligase